jgi:YVTN family beta-propeller protein
MMFRRIISLAMVLLTASGMLLCEGSNSWISLVTLQFANHVIPIEIPSNITGSTIDVGSLPEGVAITPDGTRALVTNLGDNTVSILDLTQTPITVISTVDVGSSPRGVAITPDGNRAIVTNSGSTTLSVLDLTHTPIPVTDITGMPVDFIGVAITPDGERALIANGNDQSVYIFDLTQSPIALTSTVAVGLTPVFLAVTPDGSKAIVTNYDDASVSVLDLTQTPIIVTDTVGVGVHPSGIGISPDGSRALVSNHESNTISVLDLTQSPVVVSQTITVSPKTWGVAISPDGKRAVLPGIILGPLPQQHGFATILDLSQSPTTVIDTIALGEITGPFGAAITPDQAPTSLFSVNTTGLMMTCDGSASSSPVGGIATYRWDFGDGVTEGTTNPVVAHMYATEGTYTVALTVVNDAGTSTEESTTFTGQTMSNHGLPRARSTQEVTIAFPVPDAPSMFKGKIHLRHKHKKVIMKTQWTRSQAVNLARYEIFAHNRRIAHIPAYRNPLYTIHLHPKFFPHHVTKKFRLSKERKYQIRAVATNGMTSPFTPVIVGK